MRRKGVLGQSSCIAVIVLGECGVTTSSPLPTEPRHAIVRGCITPARATDAADHRRTYRGHADKTGLVSLEVSQPVRTVIAARNE